MSAKDQDGLFAGLFEDDNSGTIWDVGIRDDNLQLINQIPSDKLDDSTLQNEIITDIFGDFKSLLKHAVQSADLAWDKADKLNKILKDNCEYAPLFPEKIDIVPGLIDFLQLKPDIDNDPIWEPRVDPAPRQPRKEPHPDDIDIPEPPENIMLSARGQAAAKAAYEQAMREREERQQRYEQDEKETELFKDIHYPLLNAWEYDIDIEKQNALGFGYTRIEIEGKYKFTMEIADDIKNIVSSYTGLPGTGDRKNIKELLSTLNEILPIELKSKWKPKEASGKDIDPDVLIKKNYYRAVRIVHPDRSIGRGDSLEYQVICDYIFQALDQAFNAKFG